MLDLGEVPVDLSELARLMGNNEPARLTNMLTIYWATESNTPQVLRNLAHARDSRALANAAHGAKGAAASVGATRVADLCKALELSARSGDWEDVAVLTEKVEQGYKTLGAYISGARRISQDLSAAPF